MSQFGRAHDCRECEGWGEVACDGRGPEVECEACRGTGLDPGAIDLDRLQAAMEAFGAAHSPSREWAVDGVYVGRVAADGATLAYDDFRLDSGGGGEDASGEGVADGR